MFTGIIEAVGVVKRVVSSGSNRTYHISSLISGELKPDQSVSHNGVCLTVESVVDNIHQVTAIQETLDKTSLATWKEGDLINLERCVQLNGRLDGHLVQGHVDSTGQCLAVTQRDGSWEFKIGFDGKFANLIIEKGSICMDGISLTIFNTTSNSFSVAIVPFTYQHTNISRLQTGDQVNLEFDLVGKYITRTLQLQQS